MRYEARYAGETLEGAARNLKKKVEAPDVQDFPPAPAPYPVFSGSAAIFEPDQVIRDELR
jgi:hypothetical protein